MPVDLVLFADILDRNKSALVEESVIGGDEHFNVLTLVYKDITTGNHYRVIVDKSHNGDYYTRVDTSLAREKVAQVVRPVTVWEKVYD